MNIRTIKKYFRDNRITHPFYMLFKRIRTIIVLTKQNRAFKKYGEDTFRLVVNTLNDNGIQYFPAFGTLLGLMRNGHLIPHDLDLDFGVFADDEKYDWNELISILDKAGFSILRWFEHGDIIHEIAFIGPKSTLVNVDFFVFTNNEKITYNYYYAKRKEKEYKNKNEMTVFKESFMPINMFTKVEFLGVKATIPVNAEEILQASYTSLWRVSDKSWRDYNKPNCKEIEGVIGHVHFE